MTTTGDTNQVHLTGTQAGRRPGPRLVCVVQWVVIKMGREAAGEFWLPAIGRAASEISNSLGSSQPPYKLPPRCTAGERERLGGPPGSAVLFDFV